MFSGEAALADKRVAFVVGNGAYKNVPQLPNPPIDAKLMASTLRNVGFDVVEGYNLTRDKMTEKLLEFGHKAEGADIAVFYYAGHGIAMGGTNYLLPIDADLKGEADVKRLFVMVRIASIVPSSDRRLKAVASVPICEQQIGQMQT